jgi:uncharacterized membrane protein YwaF
LEYVFKKKGEVMAMNLSPNIFYISSCGDKCNCPLVGCIILFLLFYENFGGNGVQINIFCVVLLYVFVGLLVVRIGVNVTFSFTAKPSSSFLLPLIKANGESFLQYFPSTVSLHDKNLKKHTCVPDPKR